MLREALRRNPRHKEARSQLQALKKDARLSTPA